VVTDLQRIGRAEIDVAIGDGGSGFAFDVEGRRVPLLIIAFKKGEGTGRPSSVLQSSRRRTRRRG